MMVRVPFGNDERQKKDPLSDERKRITDIIISKDRYQAVVGDDGHFSAPYIEGDAMH
jgi:hypothetical protein